MTRAETAAFLREHDHYCILTHRRPDGDTIGSSAALCLGLRAMGKTAWLLRNPQFTPRFAAVLEGLVCEDVPDEATIVSVDVAAPDLLPIGREGLAAQVQLVIDHHARSSVSAEHRLVEAERAACGEIIFGLLELLGVSLDARMAEAIYIAISTDTGCFQYSNTTADTLRIAAACKDAGADTYPINKLFFGTKSFARLKLEARLTGSAEFYADGKVALVELPQAWLDELGASEDDVDSIAGFARAIEGVSLASQSATSRAGTESSRCGRAEAMTPASSVRSWAAADMLRLPGRQSRVALRARSGPFWTCCAGKGSSEDGKRHFDRGQARGLDQPGRGGEAARRVP